MNVERFSVSMCVYEKDNPEWFALAVESVLQQTVTPSEIVLVVDGPVGPELENIICGYEQIPCFRVIWLAENTGHGNARRVGFEACRHELIAIMDADDICVPDRFRQQLAVFARENPDIVGGNIREFVDLPDKAAAYRNVPTSDDEIKDYLKRRCPFNQVTVMFRKSAVQAAGGYLDWYCDEDYYLWIRMARNGCRMMNTGTVLVNVRVGEQMYDRRGGMRYFISEAKLQKYMLDQGVIGPALFLTNVAKRLIVQVLLPGWLRGWVYKKFAREN